MARGREKRKLARLHADSYPTYRRRMAESLRRMGEYQRRVREALGRGGR